MTEKHKTVTFGDLTTFGLLFNAQIVFQFTAK